MAKKTKKDIVKIAKQMGKSAAIYKKKAIKDAKKPKNKGGAPSTYSIKTATEICSHIASGKSIRTIAKIPGMPSIQTIFNWLNKHPEFVEQYARSKEEQIESLVEEMLDIADDSTNDYMTKLDPTTGEEIEVKNPEQVQRSRLRIDTRKWLASKLKAKKYGDKLAVEHDMSENLIDKLAEKTPSELLQELKKRKLI